MAKATISRSGNRVLVSLDFTEAAATLALLGRVGTETHEAVCDHTTDLFVELSQIRDCVESSDDSHNTEWPDEFDSFGTRTMALVDPEGDADFEEAEALEE